jgi:hypothetical protein
MIIALIILTTIIILVHKGLMKAVESYEYGYDNIEYKQMHAVMYWDRIKDPDHLVKHGR